MKNILVKYLSVALLSLFISQVVNGQEPDKITVTGKGEVFRKPDVVYITLFLKQHGVLTVDAVKKAKENSDEIQKVIKQTDPDILEIDIIDFRLGEKTSRSYRPDEDAPATPEVIKRIRITSKPDPETVHKIVDAAIRAGAVMEIESRYMGTSSELGTVVYGITKFEQTYKEAQRDAITKAKSEAQNTAELLNRKLGKILQITSRIFTTYRVYRNYDPFPTEFLGASPEKILVAATVTVVYELE